MMLAEYLGKRDEFEKFLTEKIEKHEEELKSKEKNKEEAK